MGGISRFIKEVSDIPISLKIELARIKLFSSIIKLPAIGCKPIFMTGIVIRIGSVDSGNSGEIIISLETIAPSIFFAITEFRFPGVMPVESVDIFHPVESFDRNSGCIFSVDLPVSNSHQVV